MDTAAVTDGHVVTIPSNVRRNHWMNQVAVHADVRPDAVAWRQLGVDTTWSQTHQRITALAAALSRSEVSGPATGCRCSP